MQAKAEKEAALRVRGRERSEALVVAWASPIVGGTTGLHLY